MIKLKGAVVCVTGGARGIGRATANSLAARGATVWIGDLDADECFRTAREIGVKAAHLDVTDESSVAAFHRAASTDGPVSMLVNNAGIQYMGSFVDQKLSAYHREVAVNLVGVINGMHEFLPEMLERNYGHVVNVASMAAKVTTPGISVYCATKYAVAALSRAVRAEIADTDVTITTLMPTAVHTELTAGVSLNLLPTREPEQIAETISDSARRPGREVTVPWWLAPFGAIEEVTPEPLMQRLKRIATRNEPPGHFDEHRRRGYLDRIG
ncbi:MAG: short-chain dehydrogenase [Mycobacterium sp.]|nr:MAG: short-chain dehydrogenase [Mycobacterium sp.]